MLVLLGARPKQGQQKTWMMVVLRSQQCHEVIARYDRYERRVACSIRVSKGVGKGNGPEARELGSCEAGPKPRRSRGAGRATINTPAHTGLSGPGEMRHEPNPYLALRTDQAHGYHFVAHLFLELPHHGGSPEGPRGTLMAAHALRPDSCSASATSRITAPFMLSFQQYWENASPGSCRTLTICPFIFVSSSHAAFVLQDRG